MCGRRKINSGGKVKISHLGKGKKSTSTSKIYIMRKYTRGDQAINEIRCEAPYSERKQKRTEFPSLPSAQRGKRVLTVSQWSQQRWEGWWKEKEPLQRKKRKKGKQRQALSNRGGPKRNGLRCRKFPEERKAGWKCKD